MSSAITLRSVHDNPIRGRLNAWFFHVMESTMDAHYGARKRALFADLPRTIVEIGAGAGANLRYYRAGTHVHAIEPNPHMHARLAARAASLGVGVTIHTAPAEAIPLPDASVEAVVSTLVLCTVHDPAAVLAEVRRVLRPGGRFVCLEHVAAEEGTALAALQRAIRRPWAYVFEGCHTHRETGRALTDAGFSALSVERFRQPTPFVPVRPHLVATAVR